MSNVTISISDGQPIHFLLGEDAIMEYEENGIDGVVQRYEDNDLGYGTAILTEGCSLFSFLNDLDGWNNWIIITKEQYDKL